MYMYTVIINGCVKTVDVLANQTGSKHYRYKFTITCKGSD